MNYFIEKQLPVAVEDWNTYRVAKLLENVGPITMREIRLKSFVQVILQHLRAVYPDTDDDDILPCRVSFDDNHHVTSVYISNYNIEYPKTHVQ